MLSNRRTTLAVAALPLALLSLVLLGCTASPPAGVVVTPGDGAATVSFLTDTGHRPYDYEVRTVSGDHSVTRRFVDQQVAIRISGLENGVAYSFVVRSRGLDGLWSEWSLPTESVVPRGAPAAPTISRVAGFVDLEAGCTARVTFAPGSDGGSPITGYRVSVSDGSAPVHGTSSPIEVPGLAAHTPYTFTVRALNAVGEGPPSAPFTGSCS